MNISVKSEYALKAVFDLAAQYLATPRGAPSMAPVKIANIADRQSIPQKFLELILAGLKQGGFVDSRRGAEGGYLLARSADTLTVGEVIRFVEGTGQAKSRPRRQPENAFTGMWRQVDQAISDVVDKTTFADILRTWSEKQNKFVLNWEI